MFYYKHNAGRILCKEGDNVTNMGLAFYPKPQLDIVLHQTARDKAAGIKSQCILKLDIPFDGQQSKTL